MRQNAFVARVAYSVPKTLYSIEEGKGRERRREGNIELGVCH